MASEVGRSVEAEHQEDSNHMPKETDEERKTRELIEEIASNVAMLSRQVGAILGGRLKRDAIVTLLVHSTKMSRREVDAVLSAIADLEKDTLKK